jgi:type IV pilus assembly protein PilV
VTRPRAGGGLALVEALVVLVVFLVGLLGVAALYGESLLAARSAAARSRAAMLAGDLAERMRANHAGIAAYADGFSAGGHLSSACRSGGGGCAPPAMALNDKAEWTLAVAASLPAGRGSVVAAPLPVGGYMVTISWIEPGAGPQSYQLRVRA